MAAARAVPKDRRCQLDPLAPRGVLRCRAPPPLPAARRPWARLASNRCRLPRIPRDARLLAVSGPGLRRFLGLRLRLGRPEGPPCRCRPSTPEGAWAGMARFPLPEGIGPRTCHPVRPEGRSELPAAVSTPKSSAGGSPAPFPEGRVAGRRCAGLPREVPLAPGRVSRRRPGVDQTTASFLIASRDGALPEGRSWPRWPKPAGSLRRSAGARPQHRNAGACNRGTKVPRSPAVYRRSGSGGSHHWPAPKRQNRGPKLATARPGSRSSPRGPSTLSVLPAEAGVPSRRPLPARAEARWGRGPMKTEPSLG